MQVGCQNQDGTTEWEATAWPYGPPGNTITASHFAQSCGAGNTIVMETNLGQATGTLTQNDPTHDLASYLLTPISEAPTPLSASTAHVGQEVALVGFPGGNPNPALNGTQICYGRISALNQTQALTGPGFSETLTDATTVNGLSCPMQPGMSGGVAFDTHGNVVGVIEGGNGQQSVLTPISDVSGLRSAAVAGTPKASPATLIVGSWSGMRPTTIDYSADAGNIVTGISWSSWTATEAQGEGTSNIQNCIPNCAQGTQTPYPTTIMLIAPHGGHFTEITEDRNGQSTTATYGAPGWPMSAS